jgi:TIR domain-containing protein
MKVFLSYSHADSDLAKHVAHTLRKSGLEVWDDSQVLPGDNWGEKLAQALEESSAMVILLTPNWVKSPYATHELSFALGNRNYEGRVVPVLAAPPEKLPMDQIPWILGRFQMIRLPDEERDGQAIQQIADALRSAA